MPGPKPGALPLGDTPLISRLVEYNTEKLGSVKNFCYRHFLLSACVPKQTQEEQKKNRRLAVFRLGSFFDLLLTPLYNNFYIEIVKQVSKIFFSLNSSFGESQ